MRLDQLQAFLMVSELGSFQQAALNCGLTQSTISRQVQALEAELSCQLLHRGSPTKLTVAGELFLRRARRICLEWDLANQELAELYQGKQTELCVAAIPSVCLTGLPSLLPKFCQQYPQTQLRVTSLGSDRALKVLRDGLVDVAIIMGHRSLNPGKEWVVQVLYEEPIALLLSASHPLAQQQQIAWEQLGHYPQVVFKDGYRMRRLVEEEFSRRGVPLVVGLELNMPDAFCGVVRASQMVAIMPQSLLQTVVEDAQLVVRPLVSSPDTGTDGQCSPLQRQVVVVTTIDRLEIPPIANFFNLVADNLKSSSQTVKDK